MVKAIACVILLIGLLKFAQEAPDLFKKIFTASELFAGLDLNPRGQLKRDLTAAGKTAKPIWEGTKKVIGAPGKAARGIAGGFAGAQAGANSGGGFLGGARGLISGAKVGALSPNMATASSAGQYAGGFAGATTQKQRKEFDTSRGQYDTMLTAMMDTKKSDIEKQNDAKKALKAEYDGNVNKYRQDHVEQYMNDAVHQEMVTSGRTEQEVRADQNFMNSASSAVNTRIKNEAEALYKADYDARKSDVDHKIAKLKGEALDVGASQKAISELMNAKADWGDKIKGDYTTEFNKKMSDQDMDKQVAASVNHALQSVLGTTSKYAGDGTNATLSDADIKKLVSSIDGLSKMQTRTAAQDDALKEQQLALAQIMNNMNGAMKKANSSLAMATTAQNTYNPAPPSGNGGGSGS